MESNYMRLFHKIFALLGLLCVFGVTWSFGQTRQVNRNASASAQAAIGCDVPAPKAYVSDSADLFSQTAVRSLEKKLSSLKANHRVEMAVTVIGTTSGEDIFDYSLRLAQCWGYGSEKRGMRGGILLLIAKNDRQWRIQVTNDLNKTLTDGIVKALGDKMGTQFKLGKYDVGVIQLIGDIAAEVGK